jgi:hypothetical protein
MKYTALSSRDLSMLRIGIAVLIATGLLVATLSTASYGGKVYAQGAQLLLNEVEIDPPSASDDACQYVEVRGTASSVVPAGTFFLSVNGDSGNFGSVTNAVDLSGLTVGTNGTITIILDPVNIADCSSRTYGTGTTFVLIDDAFSVVGGGAESYLLVNTASVIADGDDIDGNNDEVIDPALSITVLDGFALTVNDTLQADYAPLIYDAFTQGGGSAELPDAASRCSGDLDALDATAWAYGELPGTPDNTTGSFSSPTNQAGYNLTPGAANQACQ